MKKLLLFAALIFSIGIIHGADISTATNLFKPSSGGFYERTPSYTLSVNGVDVPVLNGSHTDYRIDYDVARFAAPTGTKTTARIVSQNDISSISIHPLKLNIQYTKIDSKTVEFEVPDPSETPYYLYVKINGRQLVVARDVPETIPTGSHVFNVGESLAAKNINPSDPANVAAVTAAVQEAIDKATEVGTAEKRGVAYIPAGVYYVGNIVVKSNVELFIPMGTLIHATSNKNDYTVYYNKTSLAADGTWWISTVNDVEHPTENVYIHGLGTIDANGAYWDALIRKRNNTGFCITALHLIHSKNLKVDGLTILQTPMWGTMVGRCDNVSLTNMKFLNMQWGGENDGIDVMESDGVTVDRAIGICLDDPFSTKTWMGQELFKNWTGEPRPLNNVTFNHCVSWTYCGAFKMGHGAQQLQTNVSVRNSVVLNSGRALGIEPKYVNTSPIGGFHHIVMENIDIEHASGEGWLNLVAPTPGVGYPAIHDVTLRNINIRQKGSPSTLRGVNDEFIVDGVVFDNITLNGNPEPVTTLAELNITNTGFYKNVRFEQDPSHDVNHLIEAENWNEITTGSTVNINGNDADHRAGQYISGIESGANKYLLYKSVDFGSSSQSITLRVKSQVARFKANVRIDSPDGEIITTGEIAQSSAWKDVVLPLEDISGSHDLYISFEKVSGPGNQLTGFNYFIVNNREVNDLQSLTGEDVTVNIYASTALTPVYTPANAYQREIEWNIESQTPADAVTLSRDGVVTGVKPGSAVITATSLWDSSIKATFNITVVDEYKFDRVRIEAEDADEIFSPYHYDAAMSIGAIKDPEDPNGRGLNSCWDTNFAVFKDVNFGDGALRAFIRKGYVRGSAMEMWIDPEIDRENQKFSGGIKIAEIEYPAIADDWNRWQTFECPVSEEAKGTHTLVLYFKSGGGSGHDKNYGSYNWIEFLCLDNRPDLESISADDIEIQEGLYGTIEATVYPENARTSGFDYTLVSAAPEGCITLLEDGRFKADKKGTAVIKVSDKENKEICAEVTITVTDAYNFTTVHIEAEDADEIFSPYHYDAAMSIGAIKDPEDPNGQGLNSCWNTNFAVYNNVDFYSGAVSALIRKGYVRGSAMEMWIDPEIDRENQKISGGIKIAEIEYPAIATDWSRWQTFECPVSEEAKGVHTLVLYFKAGGGSATNQNYGSYNWIEFKCIDDHADLESISAENITIHEGLYGNVEVTTYPENARTSGFDYSVVSAAPEGCITLLENGRFKAVKKGDAVIKVTDKTNSEISTEVKITVIDGAKVNVSRLQLGEADHLVNTYCYTAQSAIAKANVSDPDGSGSGYAHAWHGNFVILKDVDFGEGLVNIDIRKELPRASALELLIDPEYDVEKKTISGGKSLSSFVFDSSTGNAAAWKNWYTWTLPLNFSPAGIHTLALRHTAGGGTQTNQDFGGANWIELRTLSDIPTDVADLADDKPGFNIGCEGGDLIINSIDQIRVNIFRCDGTLVRSLTVDPGVTRVSGLDKGIYIINRTKIVIR